MKIVNIRGANGSGKTTIAKQLMSWSWKTREEKLTDIPASVTILDSIGWMLIGKYRPEKKMGGCDTIDKLDYVKHAIDWAITTYQDQYWILFESMMISTIKSTFYDYLIQLSASNPDLGIEPTFVFLDTTVDACIRRIQGRGTMRAELNPDNIQKKLDCVHRHMKAYDPKYCVVMQVDQIPEERMLEEFLKAIGDEDVLRYIRGQ